MISSTEIERQWSLSSSASTFGEADGLFLQHGNDISDGAGLLMGKNSPFKNIPVFGCIVIINL